MEGWPALLESFGETERRASVAFVAGREVSLGESERNEAVRRAVVVRAVGGDPHRELALDEDAVTRLADELDAAGRRTELRGGLLALERVVIGPRGSATVARLLEEPDLAWRAFAAALLAAELADE